MTSSSDKNSSLIFLRFHLRVGARIALKNFTPILAVIFALFYLLRPEFFGLMSFYIFTSKFYFLPVFFFSIICIFAAFIASRRICLGTTGWIRHLPSSSQAQRRSVVMAVFLAITPIILLQLVFIGLALPYLNLNALMLYLTGLPGLSFSAAQAAVPIEKKYISKIWAVLAGWGFMSGVWLGLPLGIFCLLLSDRTAGPLAALRKERTITAKAPGSLLVIFLNWRALKYRLPAAYIPSVCILGLTFLFIRNNELTARLSLHAAIFGACLAGAVFTALTANFLSALFPPWPWARSLPWSSLSRICIDTLFLFFHSLLPLIPAFIIFPSSIPALLIYAFTVALYASGARHAHSFSRMGPAGHIILFGGGCAALLCLFPHFYVLFFLSIYPLLKNAAAKEARRKVSAWSELHHLAAGDSLSWSRR